MKISPLDIRKQNFKRALRGVDPEEVRMFLEVVASEYEKVLQDNAMMAEKLRYQEQRLDEYRELERSMRNSLVTADRIANESREASEREAGRIIQDAQMRAERILEDSRERLQKLVQDVESLRSKKDIYVRRFRTMLEAQLSVLNEQGQQFDEIHGLENAAHSLLANSQPPLDADAPSDSAPVERPSSNGSGNGSASRFGGSGARPFRMSVVPPPASPSRRPAEVPEARDIDDLAPRSVASFEIDAHESATTFPSPGAYGAPADIDADECDDADTAEPMASSAGSGSVVAESTGDLFAQRGEPAASGAAGADAGTGGGEDASRDEPAEPGYSKVDVRGVGRFFRRTHSNLSLENGGRDGDVQGVSENEDGGEDSPADFFRMQQRSEGFFEIDAAERSRKA